MKTTGHHFMRALLRSAATMISVCARCALREDALDDAHRDGPCPMLTAGCRSPTPVRAEIGPGVSGCELDELHAGDHRLTWKGTFGEPGWGGMTWANAREATQLRGMLHVPGFGAHDRRDERGAA
jgi:hypothetical protein